MPKQLVWEVHRHRFSKDISGIPQNAISLAVFSEDRPSRAALAKYKFLIQSQSRDSRKSTELSIK